MAPFKVKSSLHKIILKIGSKYLNDNCGVIHTNNTKYFLYILRHGNSDPGYSLPTTTKQCVNKMRSGLRAIPFNRRIVFTIKLSIQLACRLNKFGTFKYF